MIERRKRDLALVGDLIDSVLGKVASAGVAPVVRLRQVWPDVAGEWAAKCHPAGIRNGVLTLEVGSGMDASLLKFAAPQLVRSANEALDGEPEITRISVRVRTPK